MHTMKHHGATHRRNEIQKSVARQMNQRSNVKANMSDKERQILLVFSSMWKFVKKSP